MAATTRQHTSIAIAGDGIELRMQEIGGEMTVAFAPYLVTRGQDGSRESEPSAGCERSDQVWRHRSAVSVVPSSRWCGGRSPSQQRTRQKFQRSTKWK